MASSIYDDTNGNPFFVGQVIEHLLETGALRKHEGRWTTGERSSNDAVPDGVRDIVNRRVARLSTEADRALTVAAVIGHEFELRTLAAVPGAPGGLALLDAVDEAIHAHLLQEASTGTISFVHALVRRTLLDGLSTSRRAHLHRQIGEVLVDRPDTEPAVIAYHLCAGAIAGSVHEAAHWAERALRTARDRCSYEELLAIAARGVEVTALERAPDLAAGARLRLLMAEARDVLGDRDGSRREVDLAADDARGGDDPVTLAEAAEARSWWFQFGRPDPDAAHLLQEALDALGGGHPATRARLLGALAGYQAVSAGDRLSANQLAKASLELAESCADTWTLVRSLLACGVVGIGDPDLAAMDEVVARFEQLTAGADGLVSTYSRCWVARLRVVLDLQRGERSRSQHHASLFRAANFDANTTGLAPMWAGMYALMDGDLAAAERANDELRAAIGPNPNLATLREQQHRLIRREQGRSAELVSVLARAEAPGVELAFDRAFLALIHVELGQLDKASAELAALTADGAVAVPHDSFRAATLAQLSEVCVALGDIDAAQALHSLMLAYQGQLMVVSWGVACLGAADRYLGMLEATMGDSSEAEGHFAAALTLEERVTAPSQTARTRLWWACLLQQLGPSRTNRARAEALIADARHQANALGLAQVLTTLDSLP